MSWLEKRVVRVWVGLPSIGCWVVLVLPWCSVSIEFIFKPETSAVDLSQIWFPESARLRRITLHECLNSTTAACSIDRHGDRGTLSSPKEVVIAAPCRQTNRCHVRNLDLSHFISNVIIAAVILIIADSHLHIVVHIVHLLSVVLSVQFNRLLSLLWQWFEWLGRLGNVAMDFVQVMSKFRHVGCAFFRSGCRLWWSHTS